MRTRSILFAAAVSAGGLCFSSSQLQAQNAVERTGNAIERTADRLAGTTRPSNSLAPDAEDIREMLREVTQAALTKGGLDDMVERFVDADRNRLGKDNNGFLGKDHDTLDGRIAQFQKDWKAKYNQDFKIQDKEAVFTNTFAMIIQSEIGGTARLAGEQQTGTAVNPAPGMQRDNNTANRDANRVAGGDTNRDPGRNIASVQVAASHGMPGFTVPLIHELPDAWKIDAPDSLTSQQFHDSLLKHLTMVNDAKDRWPADVNEAYRLVSHHILMAVLNVPESGNLPTTPGMVPDRPMNTLPSGASNSTGGPNGAGVLPPAPSGSNLPPGAR